jgi:hypothetical protein
MSTKTYNIWIWDIAHETMMRLTLDETSSDTIPLWTPDGERIVYSFNRENKFGLGDIYWKAADGAGEAEKLASSPGRGLFPWSWSSDGKILCVTKPILFSKTHTHNNAEILCFIGGNPVDIQDFGAEVEVELGNEHEKHIITQTSCISMPANLPHCPLSIKKVTKPIVFLEISLTPAYKAVEGRSR